MNTQHSQGPPREFTTTTHKTRIPSYSHALAWEYCDHCEASFLRCPKCGINTCSGGYGEVDGVECNLCPSIYAIADFLHRKDGR